MFIEVLLHFQLTFALLGSHLTSNLIPRLRFKFENDAFARSLFKQKPISLGERRPSLAAWALLSHLFELNQSVLRKDGAMKCFGQFC